MNNTSLKRRIMRRVYYAFALNLIATPGVLRGFFMLAVIIGLTHFVSLGNVLNNLMHVEVGHLGTFFYNAFVTTEMGTLLLLGVFIYSILSFRFKIPHAHETPAFAKV